MSQSWIVRSRDRVFYWLTMKSLKLFVEMAYVMVVLLAAAFMVLMVLTLLSWLGIITQIHPEVDAGAHIIFAGTVISLLLCIGERIGAFDWLRPREK